jgi:hypothetical protein
MKQHQWDDMGAALNVLYGDGQAGGWGEVSCRRLQLQHLRGWCIAVVLLVVHAAQDIALLSAQQLRCLMQYCCTASAAAALLLALTAHAVPDIASFTA